MKAIILTAGHNATAKGAYNEELKVSEHDILVPFVSDLAGHLRAQGAQVITDAPGMGLLETVRLCRENARAACAIVDFHLNAGGKEAVGTEALIRRQTERASHDLASALVAETCISLGTRLRHTTTKGVINHNQSARGGLFLFEGIPPTEDTARLQALLNARLTDARFSGMYPGAQPLKIDGVAGPKTAEAFKRFGEIQTPTALLEICFLSSSQDMQRFYANRKLLLQKLSSLLLYWANKS